MNWYQAGQSEGGEWSQLASSRPDMDMDHDKDVLYIKLTAAREPTETEFDDHEIFVVREARSRRVVRFTVPFFKKYWLSRLDELVDHLSSYDPGARSTLSVSLQSSFVETRPFFID